MVLLGPHAVAPNPRPRDTTEARAIRPDLLNFMRFLHPGNETNGAGLPLAAVLWIENLSAISHLHCKSLDLFRPLAPNCLRPLMPCGIRAVSPRWNDFRGRWQRCR